MKIRWTSSTRHVLWFGLLLLVCLSGAGCQTTSKKYAFSPPPPAADGDGRANDLSTRRLLPGDEITFRFPEGTNYTTQVKEDGSISMPLIGDVKASGETAYELHAEVSKLYVPRFYKRWSVPTLPDKRVYYVGGQVRSPGRQLYIAATTVTKAIESAGGFTDLAAKHRVQLTRVSGQKIEVNCLKAAKDLAMDLPVYPGDKVYVPQRTFWDSFR